MAAIQLIVRPCDTGRTVETSMISGGISEGVIQLSAAQNGALNDFLTLVRSGSSTASVVGVLALEDKTGIDDYLALVDKTGADAYLALVDKTGADVYVALEDKTTVDAYMALVDQDLADAAITIENMSAPQKAGLLAYIAAIVAEEDTSSVETAIAGL